MATYNLRKLVNDGVIAPTMYVADHTFTGGTGTKTLSYGNHGVMAPTSVTVELISAGGTISTMSFYNKIAGNIVTSLAVASPVDLNTRIIIRNY